MAARRRQKGPSTPAAEASAPVVGPARFTPARFLSDCCEETRQFLISQWSEGNQLVARRVPVDGLPPVVILSAYARDYGVELVDDYDALLDRYRENVADCCHPDKFMASCICILADRYMVPEDEAYEVIGIPKIYEELLP